MSDLVVMFDFKQIYCVNLTDGKYTWRRIVPGLGSPPSPRDKLSCWVYKTRWLKMLKASCKTSKRRGFLEKEWTPTCTPDLQTPSCRLVYFGGYGHKLLTDLDSRNRSFIVDEASWVICPWCSNIHCFSLKFPPVDCLTLSAGWRCLLGMEQWGSCIWPNEFQLEWTKNKCKPVNILGNGNGYLMDGLWRSFRLFWKFWRILQRWIVCAGSCSRPQSCPRQRHTGTQRVHLWRKSHGEHHSWPFMHVKAKLTDKHASQTLFFQCRKPGPVMFTVWTLRHGLGQKCTSS